MPNINDSFPSNYLKASDIQGVEPIVTIDHVAFEPVGRQREMKAVVYFKGKDKGVVLNKTNATKIATICGTTETDDWTGTRIKLYATETEFGGETVECIRIKPATPPPNKQSATVMTKRRPEPAEYAVEPMNDSHDDDSDVPF